MNYEHPAELLRRLKIGREEFCQRLLTMLILRGPYPTWNTRNKPSELGEEFLRRLYELSFGSSGWAGSGIFVDELELAPRDENEKGCAPDQALIWPDRLWMIELKTEKGSHRQAQIPSYFEFGSHYYPDCSIDLTYLTPPFEASFSPIGSNHRYSQVTWPAVGPLVQEVWRDRKEEAELVAGLLDATEHMTEETPSAHRARVTGAAAVPVVDRELQKVDAKRSVMELASLSAKDGEQRALEYLATDLEELQALRLEVRNEICSAEEGSDIRPVRPWLWRPESMGAPMTEAGRELGYELRLSRYEKPVCP